MRTSIVRLTREGLHYEPGSAGRTVDIALNGHRVWSLTLPAGSRRQSWPPALRELLRGSAHGTVSDSVTHQSLWTGELRWRGAGTPALTDDRGRTLRVDKWGRMKPSFETGEDIRPRVAASAATVLAFLQENGFVAFIVGGTLLGAVRDGEILPHDDDADLAYLSSHSHPSDLILENDRLHRLLVGSGFRVVRHSWSHLQVLSEDLEQDYYVDIFTAFYKSGHFHEPIHVRAPGMVDAIIPLGELELHGVHLAAPRDPEAWLTACYGPSWRVPDPSFVFETPWQTQRRFHAWFGSFHMGINNWRIRYGRGGGAHESDLLRAHVIPWSEAVIDLGSGDGEDLLAYRRAGLTAVGAESVAIAASVTRGEAAHVNLVDYLPAYEFLRSALQDADPACTSVAANHLLACQDPRGRQALLHLFAFALRRGARVITADYEELGRYRPDTPRTWHLDWPTRLTEAERAGLGCILRERTRFRDEDGVTRSVAVVEYQLQEEGVS